MVKKVSQGYNDAYIQNQFSKLPATEKGKTRQVNEGENLWSIARSELGEKASNKELNDYVFLIAKVNNLNTNKKMNQIKANTSLYMPKQVNNSQKPATTPVQQQQPKQEAKQPAKQEVKQEPKQEVKQQAAGPAKTNAADSGTRVNLPRFQKFDTTNYVSIADDTRVARTPFLTLGQRVSTPDLKKTFGSNIAKNAETKETATVSKPNKPEVASTKKGSQSENTGTKQSSSSNTAVKPDESAKTDFENTKKALNNTQNIEVSKSNIKLSNGQEMYSVEMKNPDPTKATPISLLNFIVQNGRVKEFSFEGKEDLNLYGMDYNVKDNGRKASNIKTRTYIASQSKVVGQVTAEEYQALAKQLLTLKETNPKKLNQHYEP